MLQGIHLCFVDDLVPGSEACKLFQNADFLLKSRLGQTVDLARIQHWVTAGTKKREAAIPVKKQEKYSGLEVMRFVDVHNNCRGLHRTQLRLGLCPHAQSHKNQQIGATPSSLTSQSVGPTSFPGRSGTQSSSFGVSLLGTCGSMHYA